MPPAIDNSSPFCLLAPHHVTSAGREVSKHKNQDNDCTVRALALGEGLSYDEAYQILESYGRKSNRGFRMDVALSIRRDKWKHLDDIPKRVKDFLGVCDKTKTYIICVHGHVFCVKNQQIHDEFLADFLFARIEDAFERS